MKRELLLLFLILPLAACMEAWPQEVSPGTSGLADQSDSPSEVQDRKSGDGC